MTADEFLTFDGEGDTRYQLIDGVPKAMPLGGDAHGTIVGNACGEIHRAVADHPTCRGVAAAGIRVDDRNHYQADAVATCAPPRGGPYVCDPLLIVEVLSPETRDEDLGVKLPRYKGLPSVREVWVIDSRERWVQVWRRSEGGWPAPLLLRGSATFRSDALDDEVELDRLYRNSGL